MAWDDEVYVTFLGSGTGIPSAHRGSPCIVIRYRTHYFLFDIGPGTLRALSRMGTRFDLLEAIWITHFHPDHTADLAHLLFATKYPPVLENRSPFILMGPPGLEKFLRQLQTSYSPHLDLPGDLIDIREVDPTKGQSISWQDFQFKVCRTKHTQESIAIRMQAPTGRSIVYSGDTDYSEDIVSLSQSADLLILEASFPEGQKVKGHLTPSEAGMIAEKAEVGKLVLTHFYPECLGTDIGAECRKNFTGEIVLASDGLRVIV